LRQPDFEINCYLERGAGTLGRVPTHPQRVAVIGASDDPERYAWQAINLLQTHGHVVLPVTPRSINLQGLKVFPNLDLVPRPIDTVTLYVNPRVLEGMVSAIIEARPKRVIFNPGTEHPDIARQFQEAGLKTLEACTLVLLRTGQF
jgi:predicted CoA-binding protein